MERQPDDYNQRQRTNLIAIAIAAVVVVATVTLLVALNHGIKRESCFAAGHHTCAPIEER